MKCLQNKKIAHALILGCSSLVLGACGSAPESKTSLSSPGTSSEAPGSSESDPAAASTETASTSTETAPAETSETQIETSVQTAEPPAIRVSNFKTGAHLDSGFLVGSISGDIQDVARIQVKIEGILSNQLLDAEWSSSSRTWKVALPTGTARLRSGTPILVTASALDSSDQALSTTDTLSGRIGSNRDFNGDGYADVAVFSRGVGGVRIYAGGQSVTSGVAPVAGAYFASTQVGSTSGRVQWCDLNQDGYTDLILNSFSSRALRGSVWVIAGGENTLSATEVTTAQNLLTQATTSISGSASMFELGVAVKCADFNNDGAMDLAVSARREDRGYVGSVYLFSGQAGTFPAGQSEVDAQLTLESTGAEIEFGNDLAVGDFNGDQIDDLAISSPEAGTAHAGSIEVFHGSGSLAWSSSTPDTVIANGNNGAYLGSAMLAEDIDLDGITDLLAWNASTSLLFWGSTTGVTQVSSESLIHDLNDIGSGSFYATGDFNGDGILDGVIGSGQGVGQNGIVAMHLGSAQSSHASAHFANNSRAGNWSVAGASSLEKLGSAVSVLDFNGDGMDDLLVSAPGRNVQKGGIDIYLGGQNTTAGLESTPVISLSGATAGELFGSSITQ